MAPDGEHADEDLEVISISSNPEPPAEQAAAEPADLAAAEVETECLSQSSDDEPIDAADGGAGAAALVPLPAELATASSKLERARRCGDEELEATALLQLAEVKLASARHRTALGLARQAWGIFRDVSSSARAVRVMVQANLAVEKYPEALCSAEKHLKHFTSVHNPKAQGILELTMSQVHLEMERPREALRVARAATETFKRVNDKVGRASAHRAATEALLKLGGATETRHALKDAEEALSLLRKAGDRKEEVSCLLLIAKVHTARREHEDSYAFAKGAAELAQRTDDKPGLAAALLELAGSLLAADEEPDAVVQVVQEALQVYRHLGDALGEISARQMLARVYRADGLLNFANEALEAALALARRLRARRRIGDVLETMKAVQPEEFALQTLATEVRLAGMASDRLREVVALQRLAALESASGKAADALQHAEKALELARALHERRAEGRSQRQLADLHAAARSLPEALAAASAASALLQQAGDIPGAADAMHLTAYLHSMMGNDKEASQLNMDQRTLYKTAGWKEEEASTLLYVARLQIDGSSDTKEAIKAAKEAISLYQRVHDKAGEAQAMLVLCSLQLAGRANKSELRTVRAARLAELLRTVSQARDLFKALDDTDGEAKTLQASAEVHLAQGQPEAATAAAREALKLCQRAGDARLEADALRAVAAVQISIIQQDLGEGLKPSRTAIDQALSATLESLALFESLGDMQGQTNALSKASTLHRWAKDGRAALQAARDALEMGSKLDDPHPEGDALIALAEAFVYVKDKGQAKKVLDGAKLLFGELRDRRGLEDVARLIRAAQQLPDEPPELPEPSAPPGPTAVVEGDGPAVDWSSYEDSCKMLASLQEAAARRRETLLGGLHSAGHEPDQELRRQQARFAAQSGPPLNALDSRRQQLLAAAAPPQPAAVGGGAPTAGGGPSAPGLGFEARPLQWQDKLLQSRKMFPLQRPAGEEAGRKQSIQKRPTPGCASDPQHPPPEQPQQRLPPLAAVLQAVRPDWTPKDIQAVQEKLAKVSVCSSDDLLQQLEADGAGPLNAKLKAAGQKCLKVETLEALREYGQRTAGAIGESA